MGVLSAMAALAAAGAWMARPGSDSPGRAPAEAPSRPGVYELRTLHEIQVHLTPAEWDVLQTSLPRGADGMGAPGSDFQLADGRPVHIGSGFRGYFPWVHADLVLDGMRIENAGLRYRGNYSFSSSSAARPLEANFKIKLDRFGGKERWDGVKTFNLNAGVIDASRLREAMAYELFRVSGVPAPRTTYARVDFRVPGRIEPVAGGIYTIIEEVNKSFLKRAFYPGTGLLMKPEGLRGGVRWKGDSWEAYQPYFRPDRAASPHEQQRLMDFARLVSQDDAALFRDRIGEFIDVDRFLRFVAVNALIANTDSYLSGGHNFFLYLDPADDRFHFIPWDQDLALGGRGGAGVKMDLMVPYIGEQPLIQWLLGDPAVASRYRAIVREIVANSFNRPSLLRLMEELARIGGGRAVTPREFIEARTAAVEKQLAAWDARGW